MPTCETGATIKFDDRTSMAFSWRDVREIRTYKRDLLTTDEIRLAFLIDNIWCDVAEDVEGFAALVDQIGRVFPLPEAWYARVMQPPFATNEATLYRREEDSSTSAS